MLTFIAAVAVTIAVILLFVYIIRIYRIKSKYLNDKTMRNLTKKAADTAIKKDPYVTCDFCGARIDTRIDTTCPQCGGPYGKDKEWSGRHVPDLDKARKKAGKDYYNIREKVRKENAPATKKLRILITLLVVGILVSVGLFIYHGYQKEQQKLEDQQVSSGYQPTDYGFGNICILDSDEMKVCVGNVYVHKNYRGLFDYAVELNILNHNSEILSVGVLFDKANGDDTIALMDSRIPADKRWHRKILYVHDVTSSTLQSMELHSVVASKLSYAPVAGTGERILITTTANSPDGIG